MKGCKHENATCYYRRYYLVGQDPQLWSGCECAIHRAEASKVVCRDRDCGETLPLGPAAVSARKHPSKR